MNGQRGFLLGFLVGFVGSLSQTGFSPSVSPSLAPFRTFLAALSIILLLAQYARGKTTLKPAGDGFVYGLSLSFDAISWLATGRFP
jgi:hypothetical protein